MATKKTVKEPVQKSVQKREKKAYLVEAHFNGETHLIETNDLNETIINLKPDQLLTEVFLKVTKGEATCERKLNLNEAKRVFLNEVNREVLINNLLIVNG